MDHRKIAFLGAGNMARAIISGLCHANYPQSLIYAVNRSEEKNQSLRDDFHIQASDALVDTADQAEVIVLGVKPQSIAELMQALKGIAWHNKLVISIAAGVTVPRLETLADEALNIIRVMPNTPSLVGKGMCGIYGKKNLSTADRQFTTYLMQSVGDACWVEEESQINAIIAAAGSAPAYFYFFMEAMQAEAQRQGFDPLTARQLVQQTALGAAEMVVANPQLDIATLRQQVTSKGGTTEQAILSFQQANFSETVANAMKAAVKRAEEMERLF